MKMFRVGAAGVALALSFGLASPLMPAEPKKPAAKSPALATSMKTLEKELVAKYGEGQRERLVRGLKQVAEFWRTEDGDAKAFEEFVRTNFAGDRATLDAMFDRIEFALESLDGHMLEIDRDFRMQSDLDLGPILPVRRDARRLRPVGPRHRRLLRQQARVRRAAQLPAHDARAAARRRGQRGRAGSGPRRGSRRAVLEAHPGRRQPRRSRKAAADAAQYIADYNIWMHHLVDDEGQPPLPAEDAAALALEPARRDQGGLRRRGRTGLAKQRDDPAGHGADRHPDDPRRPSSTTRGSTGTRSRTRSGRRP